MSKACDARGGTPVTKLSALDDWEATLVRALRRWCEGPDGHIKLLTEWSNSAPWDSAQERFDLLDRLLRALVTHARRPLVRHQCACGCVGADEAVLVHLIGLASDGQYEDAALTAGLLVGARNAEQVAALAAQVGTSTRLMAAQAYVRPTHVMSDATRLH